MSDLIDRQEAIEAFWKLNIELRPSAIDAITDMLKTLPSAEPEQKCESCRYHNLEWDDEPCDSCTMGGEGCHYKPERKKGNEKK